MSGSDVLSCPLTRFFTHHLSLRFNNHYYQITESFLINLTGREAEEALENTAANRGPWRVGPAPTGLLQKRFLELNSPLLAVLRRAAQRMLRATRFACA